MKKITFFVEDIFKCGGVQRVVSIISNKLYKLGYEISIILLFKTNENPFFTLESNIKVYNLFEESFDLRINYIKIIRKINKFIKNYNTDIFINAGVGYTLLTYPALKKRKEIKSISWEHQNFYFGKKFGMEWIGKRIAANKLDGIIVLTKYDLNSYNNNIKKIKNIWQIYNPIDNVIYNSNYNPDTKKIISCGSLSLQKGFDFLVEVARIVFEKYPDWQWHIWGDGIERRLIENKIKEYNLSNNLILKGYSKNVYEKYKDYSIYCMTSRHEGFPMVLLEAQGNGLPIISFDCKCGPREIVDDNENGYLINCFDIKDMAYKICDLISNREKRIEFSGKMFSKVNTFDIDTVIEKWIKLIESI